MTIVEFLTARWDELEAKARKAENGPWTSGQFGKIVWGPDLGGGRGSVLIAQDVHADDAPHIAQHDPAYVLADLEAKRRILKEIGAEVLDLEDAVEQEFGVTTDEGYGERPVHDKLLRLLAAPFADHPDYDPAWSLT